ncbi:MAG: hypothetical protein HKO03_00915 [Acidimicrobiia bacterium]|nr:hypothetical protein [Acidimicrobiia bacterium]
MAFDNGVADFRSDTVTRPTLAMRKAMAEAEVGDDVYGEDPEINRLQDEAAAIVAKEAALFVASGTMANQIAVGAHTRIGDEVLVARGAHVRQWEASAAQANSGVAIREVDAPGGAIDLDQLGGYLNQRADDHVGVYRLVSLENTFNGSLVPLDHMARAIGIAHDAGASVHLDGARLFNAAVTAGVEPPEVAAGTDTVAFCFSKGLGAPVGSVICGPSETIREARRIRKRLGGGMRQAGVLAAAARVALAGWRRLEEDHVLASNLALALRDVPGVGHIARVDSNMVIIEQEHFPVDISRFLTELEAQGILCGKLSSTTMRIVCHQDVDSHDVERLVGVVRALVD